jgi:hypothetical protein
MRTESRNDRIKGIQEMEPVMLKEKIQEFVLQLGVDAVGVAAVEGYRSSHSPDSKSIPPSVRSIVDMGYWENHGSAESANTRNDFSCSLLCCTSPSYPRNICPNYKRSKVRSYRRY